MTAKKLRTQATEKNDYRIYIKKAEDFHDIMLKARESGNWTATGLNAVHCAISCCDALLVFHLGVRSIGEDHMQVVELLSRLSRTIAGSEVAVCKRIIAKKNLIAYENRAFHQSEAFDISNLAERFYRWTRGKL